MPVTDLLDKLRGGYYTPPEVARFICEWAITSSDSNVLEPSCGDGVFIEEAYKRLDKLGAEDPAKQILGIELYESEAIKAEKRGGRVLCGDFFTLCSEDIRECRYEAIVGNPPFIRYQDFGEEYRERAFELMRQYGFSPNRLTNIWLPFLVVCCHLLTEDGRLGMVIPAELFQVKYAAETREFLTNYFANVTVISFSDLLFDGAQQEVVLLLAERRSKSLERGIRMVEQTDSRSLSSLTRPQLEAVSCKRKLPDSVKWQAYYLDNKVLDLARELTTHQNVRTASELFEVNVGIVSGQNSFFVIDRHTAQAYGVAEACVPIISRSLQLDGLILTEDDFERQLNANHNVLLFLPEGELNDDEAGYIEVGEGKGVNENYKCRIRTPWYKVPTSWKPDAFFYRQVGSYPRMVINEKRAHVTDTLHKIRFFDGVDEKAVAVAFNNSFTFVASELAGRSYGGGVLTFEPSEVRSLPIPYVAPFTYDFEKADTLARSNRLEELIEYVDNLVLIQGLGLSRSDVELLRGSWLALRGRRLARKKK